MTSEAVRPHYSENPSMFPLEGGCACGQVRYRLEAPPIIVHCCHCTLCQRETGSAFAINAVVETSQVTPLKGAKATVPPSSAKPSEALPCGPPLAGVVVRDDVDVVEPTMICTPSESGYGQTIARCPSCGTAVWSHYAGGGPLLRFVRVGTLDRAWQIAPDVHIFTASKRDFVTINDGKPQFDIFYPSKEVVYRKEALERYARLESDIAEYRSRRREAGPQF